MSDELKCGYGRFDEVKSHPLIRGPLATLDERNAATIATLRTQLAAMTAERDAALAKVAALRDALTGIEQFFSQPGEAISEKFERIGYAFHKATGMLRPGKDASMHCPHTYDEREKAFDDWCTAKAAAARNALESTK